MPTVNDPECTAIARQAVTEVLGAEAIHENDLVMGGEDFSFYQDQKPGCFVFVGTYNPDCNAVYSNHSNYFTIDETVLAGGSRVYAQMAIDWLAKNR
jgi:metal-dependent amidase/aminoacylase/carboxypeptidase family protein